MSDYDTERLCLIGDMIRRAGIDHKVESLT
jgi:hypothetical protein